MSLQLKFIILVLFFCGLLINFFFHVNSPRTYWVITSQQSCTWEHYLGRSKFLTPLSGIRRLEKHSTSFGEVFGIKFFHIFDKGEGVGGCSYRSMGQSKTSTLIRKTYMWWHSTNTFKRNDMSTIFLQHFYIKF